MFKLFQTKSSKRKYNNNNTKSKRRNYPFNPDWMSKLSEKQREMSINKLIIPGSHDSGAYKLSTKLGIAIDRPNLNTFFINQFSMITFPIIERYSKTQNLNVYKQLLCGCRYFDLRIGLNPSDDHFYILHNFYGPKLREILEQINRFIQFYQQEIIILDIQHIYNIDNSKKFDRLINLFQTIFSTQMFLYSHDNDNNISQHNHLPSINDMMINDCSIIVIYRGDYRQPKQLQENLLPKFFWPKKFLLSPWPNTTNSLILENFLKTIVNSNNDDYDDENNICDNNQDHLLILQIVLTPNNDFVIKNFWGSLQRLSSSISNIIIDVLTLIKQKQQKNRQKLIQNIVMYDFIDRKTNDGKNFIIDLIIDANFNANDENIDHSGTFVNNEQNTTTLNRFDR